MSNVVQLEQVTRALLAMKEFLFGDSSEHKKAKLFVDTYLKLYFTLKKMPINSSKQSIRILLPHGFLNKATASICLITKDLDKRKKRDTETCVNHFKSVLLEDKNIDYVDEIISLKQLKIEHRTFEARRKLCSAYDVFLVDDRVANLVAPYLGRTFQEANKFPYAIKITKGNLNNQIEKCLRTTRLNFTQLSTRCCVQFGNLDQSVDDLLENLQAVLKSIEKHLPGSFANVRTMDINVADCPLLPVYVSTGSANDVRLPVPPSKPLCLKPVIDAFDSFENRDGAKTRVKVWPHGRVKLIKSDSAEEQEPRRTGKRKLRNVWTKQVKRSRLSRKRSRTERAQLTEEVSEIKGEVKQERSENSLIVKTES